MASIVTSLLSGREMDTSVRFGAALDGIGFGKSAQTVGSIADAGLRGLVVGSLITGIPVGILAHVVHKRIKDKRMKEKEMDRKIDYYRNLATSIESGLAGAGAQLPVPERKAIASPFIQA